MAEEGGGDAGALTTIATSSRYGAPQSRPPAAARPEAPNAPTAEPAPEEEQPAAEAIEKQAAPALPRDPRLVALLLTMCASLLAAVAFVFLRRSRGGEEPRK